MWNHSVGQFFICQVCLTQVAHLSKVYTYSITIRDGSFEHTCSQKITRLIVEILPCQPRVTVTSWFVYRVVGDLESIDHLCINPIRRIGLINK